MIPAWWCARGPRLASLWVMCIHITGNPPTATLSVPLRGLHTRGNRKSRTQEVAMLVTVKANGCPCGHLYFGGGRGDEEDRKVGKATAVAAECAKDSGCMGFVIACQGEALGSVT